MEYLNGGRKEKRTQDIHQQWFLSLIDAYGLRYKNLSYSILKDNYVVKFRYEGNSFCLF